MGKDAREPGRGEDKGVKKSLGDASDDQGESRLAGIAGEGFHGTGPDVGTASDMSKQAGNRAFEARDTQEASRSSDYTVNPVRGADKVGESITTQGNELSLSKTEPGRVYDESDRGAAGRPSGKSTPRMSTGVAPEREHPIAETAEMPPGDQGG